MTFDAHRLALSTLEVQRHRRPPPGVAAEATARLTLGATPRRPSGPAHALRRRYNPRGNLYPPPVAGGALGNWSLINGAAPAGRRWGGGRPGAEPIRMPSRGGVSRPGICRKPG